MNIAVLGAGGAVGQRFIERLTWPVTHLVGSDEKMGKRYGEVTRWMLPGKVPEAATSLSYTTLSELLTLRPGIAFSALPGGTAGPVETSLAKAGWHVFSNARDHRMDPRVPLLIPEVNPDHLALAKSQPGPGRIITNGNCSAIIFLMALAPIYRTFGVKRGHIVTQQAISGAGYPGVSAMDITGNVLPYIAGEEEKLVAEPQKTLGSLGPAGITPAPLQLYATATRVPVLEGHTVHMHLELGHAATARQVRDVLVDFRGPAAVQKLPSAPKQPVHVFDDPLRPQPRLDTDLERGMSVAAGRIRVDGSMLQLTVLGSNTVRGAAGQSLLNAEFWTASHE